MLLSNVSMLDVIFQYHDNRMMSDLLVKLDVTFQNQHCFKLLMSDLLVKLDVTFQNQNSFNL